MNKGSVWLDTGTIESLFQSNLYVSVLEKDKEEKLDVLKRLHTNEFN